jgi:hypothetical protein
MSNTIQLKRSSTANSIPSTTALAAGELAVNTHDGKLFFKKTVGATNSIVTLQPFPDGGTSGQILAIDNSGNLAWVTSSASGLTVRNTVGDGGDINLEVNGVSTINFDYSTGIQVTDKGDGEVFVSLGSSFKTIQVDGQSSVVAVGEDTLTLVAGNNIAITTHATAPKSITISSIGSNSPIKTFNVLGDFGLLTGTARFYPVVSDTIRTVILSTAKPVIENLLMGLYRNNEFVQYFNISPGLNYASFTNLTIPIQPNESYTVNIVTGYGSNLSMALFNIDI